MLRKFTGVTLAAAVAGGVYLTALPADASNMGFKLERSFKLESDAGRPYRNLYYVSFPLFNGLDKNLANSYPSPATTNKCVGDPGTPAGPAAGDDFLNADDALCDLWTSRDGLMTIYHFIPSSCVFEVRTAEKSAFGVRFTGGWDSYIDTNADGTKDTGDPNQALDTDRTSNPSALDDYRGVGYAVTVAKPSSPTDPTVVNTAVIVGSHDPNFPGRSITYNAACPAGTPRLEFVNLPYHTMYRTADEVLCGLDKVQDPTNGWEDLVNNTTGAAGADGEPDTCPNGIYDTTAGNGYLIQIETWDNVKDGGGPQESGANTDNLVVVRTAGLTVFGRLDFTQQDFYLTPGDAYRVTLTNRHTTTTWRSPHF